MEQNTRFKLHLHALLAEDLEQDSPSPSVYFPISQMLEAKVPSPHSGLESLWTASDQISMLSAQGAEPPASGTPPGLYQLPGE